MLTLMKGDKAIEVAEEVADKLLFFFILWEYKFHVFYCCSRC